tara:strand:- start:24114 stop:24488 length:375 start_codon:yes stop_codon:yes gene_type:complete
MNTIVGILMLLYFIGVCTYSYFTPDFSFTVRTWGQLAISGIGALYILGIQNISIMTTFVKKNLPLIKRDVNMNDDHEFYSVKDFEALAHLRQRALDLGSQEAFDIVVKLNTIIFKGTDSDLTTE